MMKLNQALEGKKAKIVSANQKVYEGIILDYIFPEDNEPEGIAGIVMRIPEQSERELLGLNENEIKSLEIIE